MKSARIAMTIEEFHQMEQPFGYKVEYWDGEARIMPREMNVNARLRVAQRESAPKFAIQPVAPSYAAQMISAFFAVFHDSIEFCDWSAAQVQKQAERNIQGYFAGQRGTPLANSVMVLDAQDEVVGLALCLTDEDAQARLDLLLVRPAYQGQRMATEMVATVVNDLARQGVEELFSDYHLCNDRSRDWHHSFGFEDVYDSCYARLKCSWLRREIWRLETLGVRSEIDRLRVELEEWEVRLQAADPRA